MKSAAEWDLNYALQLPAGEFDWLEFKGRRGLDITAGANENLVLDELSKQLSAFANTGGGVFVYGILNPTENKPRTVDDGGVAIAMKRPNTREWLEDVIPNLVEHPLKKFNVYALTSLSGAPGLANDRCIILIDIPGSEDAPHMARDQRYYARVGGKSRPIGHQIVTDILNRGRHAQFKMSFSFYSDTWIPKAMIQLPGRDLDPVRGVKLVVGASNVGKVYAKYMSLELWLPELIVPVEDRDSRNFINDAGIKYFHHQRDNTRRDVVGYDLGYPRYGSSWFDPVLPGSFRNWEVPCISTLRPEMLKDQKLMWTIQSDNSPSSGDLVDLKGVPFDVRDEHDVPG
jgi:hypothetical protein